MCPRTSCWPALAHLGGAFESPSREGTCPKGAAFSQHLLQWWGQKSAPASAAYFCLRAQIPDPLPSPACTLCPCGWAGKLSDRSAERIGVKKENNTHAWPQKLTSSSPLLLKKMFIYIFLVFLKLAPFPQQFRDAGTEVYGWGRQEALHPWDHKEPFCSNSFTCALALCLAEQLASGLVSSQGDKGLGLAVTYVLNIGFRI